MHKKTLVFLLFVIITFLSCSVYNVEEEGIPKFVNTDFTELDKIERISKFRSGSGHDYSDNFESCRSMKHYFEPDTIPVNVYTPITGTITKLSKEKMENGGNQVRIRSEEYPAIYFIIFHVELAESITLGKEVLEGQRIGIQIYSDIAVEIRTQKGNKLVSYFEVMTDSLFMQYQARGINTREDIIISKEYRDANPFDCKKDEGFPDQYLRFLEDWVFLN